MLFHHEWLENGSEGLDDLKNFKKQIDEVMAVRSRYELHPLNDGAPFLLPEQHATTISGLKIKIIVKNSVQF